jgi:alpha-1,2-glucosyltransferase
MFLPTNVHLMWRHRDRLARPRVGVLLGGAFTLYWLGYRIESHLNTIRGFLRNDILLFFQETDALRIAFFVPVAIALAALYVMRLRSWGCYALYPVSVLLLFPTELIEHRYYIVPVALLTLLRIHATDFVEGLTTCTCAALSGYFIWGVSSGAFAL